MEVCGLLCISLAVIDIKKFKNYFIIIWLSLVECWPHLEKTGMGQYFTSSPKTWRKFLLTPRLKPFLSVPWRNTGERTASERTQTEKIQSDMKMNQDSALPFSLYIVQPINRSSIRQQINTFLLYGCMNGTILNESVFVVEEKQISDCSTMCDFSS